MTMPTHYQRIRDLAFSLESPNTITPQLVQAANDAEWAHRETLEELRRALCAVGIVGEKDGHDLIRRDSVLDLIDFRRHRFGK